MLCRAHTCRPRYILTRPHSARVAVAQATDSRRHKKKQNKPPWEARWSFLGAMLAGFDDLVTWTMVLKAGLASPVAYLAGQSGSASKRAEGKQGDVGAVGSSIQEQSWEWDWELGGREEGTRVAGRLAWHSTSCGRRFPCHSHFHSTPNPHWPGDALAFSQISKFG